MKKPLLFLMPFFLILFAVKSKAQVSKDTADYPYWFELMQNDTVNFFTVQSAFNKYYEKHHDVEKEQEERENGEQEQEEDESFAIYKRWEYLTMRQMKPDGTRIRPGYMNTAGSNQKSNATKNAVKGVSNPGGNWTSLGPTPLPVNTLGQPNGMGRVNAIAFDPAKKGTIYAGSAGGGLWVTTDSGTTWATLTDTLTTLGISSIAIDPSNAKTIYIGTGDRDAADAPGQGIMKSTDGGSSWADANNGLGIAIVSKILINPNKTSTLLAATSFGIFRSTNSGASWSQVSPNSAFYKDMVFKPHNPNVIYATENGNFYRSTNGGVSFSKITSGLTSAYRGVIAVTPADTNRVYFVTTGSVVFNACYISTDGGANFRTKSTTPNIMDYADNGSGTGGQAFYDLCAIGDTTNKSVLYVGGINVFKSLDSGVHWTVVAHWVGSGVPTIHADQHVFAINPLNNRLFVGNDGGLFFTKNGGSSWSDISSGLGISEIYKIGQSATRQDLLIAGYQDNGTANLKKGLWYSVIGGDGMQCLIDYKDTMYQYGELYYGDIFRSKDAGKTFLTHVAGNGTGSISETGDWVTPYHLHSANNSVMFAGYANLWKCSNIKASSPSWTKLSNNLASSNSNLITAFDQSVVDTNVMYMSRNDYTLFLSTNVNATTPTWTDLTASLPYSGALVTEIKTHPKYPNIVYILQGGDVFVSTNKGSSWTSISGTLPASALYCLTIDKNSNSGLYIGTDIGVFYRDSTMSDWTAFYTGLPRAARIMDLGIYYDPAKSSNNKLRAGTYGRGLWSSDLYSPVSPVAAFGINTGSQCLKGNSFTFTDGSTITIGTITGWAWDFGDLSVSSAQNPKHTYTSAGTYTVKLVATSSLGTTDNTTKSLTVYPQPVPAFTVSANQCLTGNSYSFTDKSTITTGSISAWSWNFGDLSSTNPTQNPSHTYAAAGTYKVVLTTNSNNSCKDTVSKNVTVFPQPVASFSVTPTSACLSGNNFSFADKSTVASGSIASWAWDFGDSKTSTSSIPSHVYASAGSYTVKLTVTTNNGCTDNTSKTVTVYPQPASSFTISSALQCLSGNSFSMTDKSTVSSGSISSWLWDFGDLNTSVSQNPSHSYTAAGSYRIKIKVTSNNSCTDTISLPVSVYPQPTAAYSMSTIGQCLSGNSFPFTDKSTISSGSVTNWLWDFGDLSTSTTQSPTYSYTKSGKFQVKLKVTSNKGCTDTISRFLTVYPQSVAAFSINNNAQCLTGNSFSFTDKSTVSSGSLAIWQWDFGDGNAAVTQNSTHTYKKDGTFKVILKIYTDKGCFDTVSKLVTVFPLPLPSFTVNAGGQCLSGNSYTFTDASTVSSGSIKTWAWDFGDLATSASQSPSHVYAAAGVFKVILKTNTNNGCFDTVSKLVTVYPQPAAAIGVNSAGQCLTANSFVFTDKSTLSSGSVKAWTWDFGDTKGAAIQNPSETYAAAGQYRVKLKAVSDFGCADTTSRLVNVFPQMTPLFTVNASSQCLMGNSFSLTDNSTVASGNAVSWAWTFGDGGSSASQNPVHTYATSGNFKISLKVTSNNGCLDTLSKPVIIIPKPAADFKLNQTSDCPGNDFVCTDKSTPSAGAVTAWAWDFGDPVSAANTANTQNASHNYPNSGTYIIKLKITTSNNCVDSISKTVTVFPKPVSDFSINTAVQCINANSYDFKDISAISSGTVNSWRWNFGDGIITTSQNASHNYTKAGVYQVKLKAYSDNACVDSVSKTITVSPMPTPKVIGDTAVCSGTAATYTTQADSGSKYNWTVTGGSIVSGNGTNAITATFPKFASAAVWVTETNYSGCLDSESKTIIVLPSPKAKIRQTPQICPGSPLQFRDSSLSSSTYYWHFNDPSSAAAGGDTSTTRNPLHTFSASGNYDVKLVVGTAYGCSDSNTQTITVLPRPDAHFKVTYNDPNTIFHPADSLLNDTSYHWTFGDGGTGSGHSPLHTYPKNISYQVKLALTSKAGCVNAYDSLLNITVSGIEMFENKDISLTVFPNPFHETTTLAYDLKKTTKVKIVIYDIAGKELALITDENQVPGKHQYEINAIKYKLVPGVYNIKLMLNDQFVSKHVVKF